MAYTMASNPKNSRQDSSQAKTCCCPACTGIECLDRPTFFAGQLLNETDLNAAMEYVMEKNRLHNRYLHGPGTVCGLEVTCGDCEGTVNISAGYAIDPCGNDIIVCSSQPFDVIKAIKDCSKSRKKSSTTGCQPYQPPTPDCTSDMTTEWCITLEYKESPASPVTPLINQKSSCTCGSGCGCGGGCSCGCGGSGSKAKNGTSHGGGCGCSTPPPASPTTTTCQPTRTHEGYSIGICEEPEDCGSFAGLLKGTLFERILECLRGLYTRITKRMTANNISIAAGALTNNFGNVAAGDAQDTCCRLLVLLDELFTNSPFPVRCQLLQMLGKLKCPQPNADVVVDQQQAQATLKDLATLLIEYIRECICHALLPPCPCDPCDDRLIIACVTVKNGKIIDICNFGCREFAGSFPSLYYWLSAVPIVPAIEFIVDRLCCGPTLLHENSPLVNELGKWMDMVDPAGNVRQTVAAGNFALPKMLLDRVKAVPAQFSASQLAKAIPADSVNLAPLKGQTIASAGSTLDRSKIAYVEHKVVSSTDVPPSLALPVVKPGEKVIIYTDGTNILDVRPYPVEQQLADHVQQIDDLRKQITTLHATVAKLHK
jgi:hypothetical protein